MNLRPACASSTRKSTCVPKYGAGLGRSTVACISCSSSVGARGELFSPTDSVTDDIGGILSWGRADSGPDERPLRSPDPVEQFIDGLADLFELSGFRRGQVRTIDVPGLGRDLVLGDPVRRCLRVTHSWVTLAIAQPQIHRMRNLRREVLDVGVKVAVIGRREEQL